MNINLNYILSLMLTNFDNLIGINNDRVANLPSEPIICTFAISI